VSRTIVVRGPHLRDAFVEAALTLFSLAVDPAVVEPREIRETRAHGTSPEALLAHWLGECAYVFEVEGFICRSVDLAVFDLEPQIGGEPLRLYAFLHGEVADAARHPVEARSITVDAGAIAISRTDTGDSEIRLTVDY
jgi:SHS2 domain-containing protein